MASLAEINIGFKANLAQFSKQMENVNRDLKKIGGQMQAVGKKMSLSLTLPIAAIGTMAYNMAADFEDALGATDQIFKKSSEATKQWADGLPTYFGIAKKEALEYSNMMGSMLVNIGNLTEKEASEQSAKLIELAGDLTAMYGGRTQDAVRALTGALKGNNTMLDNYGMAVNDSLVKTKAMELGLMKQGEQLTLSAKQAATLALIYEQTGAAQGQAAREADGASGSIRALKTEITNLSTEIGQILLPVITPLIQKVKDAAVYFRNMAPETQKTIVVIAGLAAAIGPVLAGLGTFLTMVPSIVKGFNVIRASVIAMNTALLSNPITAIIAGFTAIAGVYLLANSRLTPLIDAQKEFDEVSRKATQSVTGEIAETQKLIKTAQNKKLSDEERTRALNRLIAKSDEHFGKLTLETIGTDEARVATENYTKALLQNAKIKAAQEKLVDVQKRKLDIELGVSDEVGLNVGQNVKKSIYDWWKNQGVDFIFKESAEYIKENSETAIKELSKLEKQIQSLIDTGDEKLQITKEISFLKERIEKIKWTDTSGEVHFLVSEIEKLENRLKGLDTKSTKKGVDDLKDSFADLNSGIQDLGNVGSVKWLQVQINKLEEEREKIATTTEEWQRYQVQIDLLKEKIKSINEVKPLEGSEKWYSQQIQKLEEYASGLNVLSAGYKLAKDTAETYRRTLDAMQNKNPDIEPETGTVDWYDYHIAKLQEQMQAVGITTEAYAKLRQELEILENSKEIELRLNTEEITEKIKETTGMFESLSLGIQDVFGSISQSLVNGLGEAESGFERFTQSLMSNVLKVISTALSGALANAILGATQTGASTGPVAAFTTPAFIASMTGAVLGAFAAIPKFADGGIVSGPTLGLMGEYAGAANNPEVIAPLSKLKDLIMPAYEASPGDVHLTGDFRINGNDLVLAVDRTMSRKKRLF